MKVRRPPRRPVLVRKPAGRSKQRTIRQLITDCFQLHDDNMEERLDRIERKLGWIDDALSEINTTLSGLPLE